MSFVCHYCLVLTFYSNNRISLIFAETIFSHFSQHFTFDKTASLINKTKWYHNGNTITVNILAAGFYNVYGQSVGFISVFVGILFSRHL